MVTIRAYRDDDFVDLARMFDDTWGWELTGTPEENMDLASLYVALALLGSDIVYVAEIDGKVEGVACLQVTQASNESKKSFKQYDVNTYAIVAQTLGESLKTSEAGRFALDFYRRLDAVNTILVERLEQKNVPWDAELKLLLTSPACRGKGVGKGLVASVFEDLKDYGMKLCMLRTDTHCAWQYYEKTGWERAVEYDWPDEEDLTALSYVKAVPSE